MTTSELPNCPNFMECPISKQRIGRPRGGRQPLSRTTENLFKNGLKAMRKRDIIHSVNNNKVNMKVRLGVVTNLMLGMRGITVSKIWSQLSHLVKTRKDITFSSSTGKPHLKCIAKFLDVNKSVLGKAMNFAAIFEDNYSRVNAIGFAIACQENWHHVRRLIPHGILKDAVHNGY